MRRVLSAALVLVSLSLPRVLCGAPAGDSTHASSGYTKSITLSGKVSPDGKIFQADDENNWNVSNALSLKGLEGRYVTVRCRMDVANRAIRVLSVEEPSDKKRSAYLGDAAFRR